MPYTGDSKTATTLYDAEYAARATVGYRVLAMAPLTTEWVTIISMEAAAKGR